jgi:hypothetical protein
MKLERKTCRSVSAVTPIFAQKLGAEISITGYVQKVSKLVLNINLCVGVVATKEALVAMLVDIRGSTDEYRSRGLNISYMRVFFRRRTVIRNSRKSAVPAASTFALAQREHEPREMT